MGRDQWPASEMGYRVPVGNGRLGRGESRVGVRKEDEGCRVGLIEVEWRRVEQYSYN